MSIEELREAGMLLPEEEWGEHPRETTVPKGPLLVLMAAAVGGVVQALLGDGRWATWIGMGVFLASLFGMVGLCLHAVDAQRERVRDRRRAIGRSAEQPSDEPAGPPTPAEREAAAGEDAAKPLAPGEEGGVDELEQGGDDGERE